MAKRVSVHKFGGTSVGDRDAIRRSTHLMIDAANRQPTLAVVSACSGTTDLLVLCWERARCGFLNQAIAVWEGIKRRHQDLANQLLEPQEARAYQRWLQLKSPELLEVLKRAGEGALPADQAFVIGTGEFLSSQLIHQVLLEQGQGCVWIDARDLIRGTGSALEIEPQDDACHHAIGKTLKPLFQHHSLVLTQGFVGQDSLGQPALLGRGGSDFSAGLFAHFLDAESLVIWTDTLGVLSADPRKVPEARTIPELRYEEARVLAQLGAKVLHPRSVDHPFRKHIPVWVKSSFQPHAAGTVIRPSAQPLARVRSITAKSDVVWVHTPPAQPAEPFPALWQNRLDCDAISITHEGWSAVLPQSKFIDWLEKSPLEGKRLQVERGLALVSVVGQRLNEVHWMVAETVKVLASAQLKAKLIACSPNGTSFSLLVPEGSQDRAVALLHAHLFQRTERRELMRARRRIQKLSAFEQTPSRPFA